MNLVAQAEAFAREKHAGQTRKFTGEPVIVHPERVHALVAGQTDDEFAQAASWTHDVREDCGVSHEELVFRFGLLVATLVHELTDKYTKEAYPQWNFRRRKIAEYERLRTISLDGKRIKLADRLDNLADLRRSDPEFGPDNYYITESALLLDCIRDGDNLLAARLGNLIYECREGGGVRKI